MAFTEAQVRVMESCLVVCEEESTPIVRAAWSLSPLFDMPYGTIYSKMRAIAKEAEQERTAIKEVVEEVKEAEVEEKTSVEVDDIVVAEIQNVVGFGAFCKVDGLEGNILLHISKIKRGFIENIYDEVHVGDWVTGTIIEENGRFALSCIG